MHYYLSFPEACTCFPGKALVHFLTGAVFACCTSGARAQTLTPELFAPGIISGPVNDAAPAFSPDGKTVYFHRGIPSLGAVILVSHLQRGKWSMPVPVPFTGQWLDIEPAMSPDGSYLIFASNRPATAGGKPLDGYWNSQRFPRGGGNLWRVDRKGGSWGEPYRLPESVNSDSSVFTPSIASNGNLYFMKPVADTGRFHLYCSSYREGKYLPPVPVSFSAADSVSDVDPAVAADESFIVFSSRRSSATKTELFIVFRENGQWGVPIYMGADVNRSSSNREARLSADHRRLYFSSNWVTPVSYPGDRNTLRQKLADSEWETGLGNIWSVPLDKWLDKRN